MTDETTNLVLVQLRELRSDVQSFRTEVNGKLDLLTQRMSSLEASMVAVRRDAIHGEETDARQQVSIDRLERHIDRIERRLDLTDAP